MWLQPPPPPPQAASKECGILHPLIVSRCEGGHFCYYLPTAGCWMNHGFEANNSQSQKLEWLLLPISISYFSLELIGNLTERCLKSYLSVKQNEICPLHGCSNWKHDSRYWIWMIFTVRSMVYRLWYCNHPSAGTLDSWYRCHHPWIDVVVGHIQFRVVVAMVLGYLAAVQVWNLPRGSSPVCYPGHMYTLRVWRWVRTGPQFYFTVPTSLAPIKYLNSYFIAT